jgi:hypothetical protein
MENLSINNIVEDFLDVPESAHHFFQDGAEPKIIFKVTEKTQKKASDIGDHLLRLRKIARSSSLITESHPQVLAAIVLAKTNNDEREISDFVDDVRGFHDEWREQAQSDAMIIALTQMTRLRGDLTPIPYEEHQLVVEAENDWEIPPIQLPPPARDLRDNYEKRLKLFWDLIDAADDIFFRQTFIQKMKEMLPSVFRKAGVDAASAIADFRNKPKS